MIAADAEGAKHSVTIEVEGLADDEEARQVAKAVADSALVKTAIFGADPNWGRIVSAAGYAGVPFEEHDLSLWLGDMLLYSDGTPLPFDAATASAYLKNNREVTAAAEVHTRPGPLHVLDLRPDARVRAAERGLHDVTSDRPARVPRLLNLAATVTRRVDMAPTSIDLHTSPALRQLVPLTTCRSRARPHRPARPQRRRQIDAAQDPPGPAAAVVRHGHGPRPTARRRRQSELCAARIGYMPEADALVPG